LHQHQDLQPARLVPNRKPGTDHGFPAAGRPGGRRKPWSVPGFHSYNPFRRSNRAEVQTLLNLLASVALLIWGTHIVRTGILRVYGADLRRVLSKSVSTRISAFLAGLGVTSLVQSSSATALIASSFVSQNLIGLTAAL